MLYAYVDDKYWYAYSDDQKAVRPGTTWMSSAELEQREAGSWDEDHGALLRRNERNQTWEFAFSDHHATVRGGTEWMSQEEFEAQRAAESG
jgi:hypothetical protein